MSSNIRVNSITPSVGNSVAIGTAGGSVVFQCDTINFSGTSGVTNFTEDISVDGHSELDNVNISGIVTTFDLNVDGQTNLDNVSVVGITTLNGDLVLDGHLDMRDSDRLRFGAGDDLQIFHNGSNNYIDNTSNLYIRVNGSETAIFAAGNGKVGLNYDGSGKFETTSTGAKVTGNLEVTGVLTYEDVTNVDSIGIVTARNGIHVQGFGINCTGITTSDVGYKFGTNGANYLYESSSDTVSLRVTSDGPYAHFKDVSGNLQMGSASGTLLISAGANEKLRITSAGNIGINSTSPKTDVDISQKTGAVALPQGTTAQRPTGSAPYIRKNTTNNALEYYDGTSWVEIITDYFPTGSVILG